MSKASTEELVKARSAIIEGIRRQMLGPGMERTESAAGEEDLEHERLRTSPSNYSCGILYPLENTDAAASEEVENEEAVEEDASAEVVEGAKLSNDEFSERLNLANQLRPSSFGITFFADHAIDHVRVHVTFGTYAEETGKDERTYFVRTPHVYDIDLSFEAGDFAKGPQLLKRSESEVGLQATVTAMRRRMNAEDADGPMAVTLMLQNTKKKGERIVPTPDECIFQPEIRVVSEENGIRFVAQEQIEAALRTGLPSAEEEEEAGLALLYREKKSYASGHGVSVDWKIEPSADGTGSGTITSEFVPTYEVPAMNYELRETYIHKADGELSMKYYSDLVEVPASEKLTKLEHLVTSYERWITEQEARCSSLSKPSDRAAGERNLAACRLSARRMRSGLKLLAEDDSVRLAFALANRAMFLQRLYGAMQRSLSHKKRYEDDAEVAAALRQMAAKNASDAAAKWRPFQLAFLLMSLAGIVQDAPDDDADRALVDLIWFPTGGGKTEAYLGLSAFTIFYRRLAYPESYGGVNIIMRYTLRMLTGQQFIRAATLICACEIIRQESQGAGQAEDAFVTSRRTKTAVPPKAKRSGPTYPGRLGDEPITIGLWMGRTHVPPKNADAKKLFDVLPGNASAENKFHVLRCPWCGTELVPAKRKTGRWGYVADGTHTSFCCPQATCPFHDRLPLQIVDEELYRQPPTLLIGTIDKFAQVAWKSEVGAFFAGRGPELIIQDELHLIAGPLGSIAGLYEMGLDEIFRAHGHHPKIIASTATIRRAAQQCAALYDRRVAQFPAPGIDAEDSYFACADEHRPGRLYVGILPASMRKATMEIRLISDLLGLVQALDEPAEIKDAFWTLTAYFNAIRELGQCQTLIADEVQGDLTSFAQRWKSERRGLYPEHVKELTSRTTTTELNQALEDLESLTYTGTKGQPHPVDLLLASNMLSVGIDVARLNLMLMVGQTKLVSEYIQASSRVGRQTPGVVFVLYDANRSRDRSYYERFRSFHASLYRYVEPTGVTPFSYPACDRALHAVAVGVLRQIPELAGDKDAQHFSLGAYQKEIDALIEAFCRRCGDVQRAMHMDPGPAEDNMRERLHAFFALWSRRASEENGQGADGLTYGQMVALQEAPRLLRPFGASEERAGEVETLTSMRSVEPGILGNVRF